MNAYAPPMTSVIGAGFPYFPMQPLFESLPYHPRRVTWNLLKIGTFRKIDHRAAEKKTHSQPTNQFNRENWVIKR